MKSRAELREEIDDAIEELERAAGSLGRHDEPTLRELLFDAGLARPSWPSGEGGRAMDATSDDVVDEALRARGVVLRDVNPVGTGVVAPVLAVHATREQRQRYLRPLWTGAEVWCQMLSEPGAGSDIGSLACRAEPSTTGWTLTGQKVWVTLAHRAHLGLLIARHDPDLPKHRGLTAFVVPLDDPASTCARSAR